MPKIEIPLFPILTISEYPVIQTFYQYACSIFFKKEWGSLCQNLIFFRKCSTINMKFTQSKHLYNFLLIQLPWIWLHQTKDIWAIRITKYIYLNKNSLFSEHKFVKYTLYYCNSECKRNTFALTLIIQVKILGVVLLIFSIFFQI